jgi:hypothetical protein
MQQLFKENQGLNDIIYHSRALGQAKEAGPKDWNSNRLRDCGLKESKMILASRQTDVKQM